MRRLNAKNRLKHGLSSSGCKSRPAKAEPSQPEASLATVVGKPCRRCVGRRTGEPRCKPRKRQISRVPRVSMRLKAPASHPLAALQPDQEGVTLARARMVSTWRGSCAVARLKRTAQEPGTSSSLPTKHTGRTGGRRPDPDPTLVRGCTGVGAKNERPS